MNYGYSDVGKLTFAYGPKGITWVEGPDGTPQYTDYMLRNPKLPITDVQYILRMHTYWIYHRDYDTYSVPASVLEPGAVQYRLKWADDPDVDSAYVLPPFELPPEANDERTRIMNDISTYTNEMMLKFITGAEPLSRFEEYRNTVKAMNIDRAIEITQEAYDNYMKQ